MNDSISIIHSCEKAMANEGLYPRDGVVADGALHRFRVEGDKPHSRNGWYVMHLDSPAWAAFGSWRVGGVRYWFEASGNNSQSTSFCDSYQRKKERDARDKAVLQSQKVTAIRAKEIWMASSASSGRHPYLSVKKVEPHNLRERGGQLVVPLFKEKKLVNLQFINERGDKYFLKGGVVKGACSVIGDLSSSGPAYICEGWATAATLHKMTSHTVVCAMNASNLVKVAKSLAAQYPHKKFVIAADDDRNTDGNPGIAYAEKAAKAIGAKLVIPKWPPDAPSTLTDFNDLFCYLEDAHEYL